MKSMIAAVAATVLVAGCASQSSKQECLPWSDDCEPDIDYKWKVETRYEGDRDPETSKHPPGEGREKLADRECSALPTPWHPEEPISVAVTNLETGETVTFDCD